MQIRYPRPSRPQDPPPTPLPAIAPPTTPLPATRSTSSTETAPLLHRPPSYPSPSLRLPTTTPWAARSVARGPSRRTTSFVAAPFAAGHHKLRPCSSPSPDLPSVCLVAAHVPPHRHRRYHCSLAAPFFSKAQHRRGEELEAAGYGRRLEGGDWVRER